MDQIYDLESQIYNLDSQIYDLESKIEELQNVNQFLFFKLKIENEYSNFKKKKKFTKSFCDFIKKENRISLYFKSNEYEDISVDFHKNEDTETIESIFIKNMNKMFIFSDTGSTNKFLHYVCEKEHENESDCYDMNITQDDDDCYVAELNGKKYYIKA